MVFRLETDRSTAKSAAKVSSGGIVTQDKRKHPRDTFESEVTVGVSGPLVHHRILDVSQGGIAIRSEKQFEPGTRLQIRYVKDNSVEVEVVGSELVESDPDFMEFHYRIRTRFLNASIGNAVHKIFRDNR